jgi:hypothetical protein
MAFVLSVFWPFTGLVSLGVLAKAASWLGVTSLWFENDRLKRCIKLGLDPEALGFILGGEDVARKRLAIALGLEREGNGLQIVDIEAVNFPHFPWLARRWVLTPDEVDNFLDGIRHLELLQGVGPDAERLKTLLQGTQLQYEELNFLWQGFGCDFDKLTQLSKKRLSDPQARALAGLPLME